MNSPSEHSEGRSRHPIDRTETDERLLAAMEEYVHSMELGQLVDRSAFLARYADVAHELAECLGGMDFVHGAISLVDDDEGQASPTAGCPSGTLGEYRVIREIGRGGMGIVYEARQQMLDRPVALKVLPLAALLDERKRTRFQNEARAAATLDHANIVRVYSVGVERGIYYYAMQLVEGLSLAEVLQAKKSATEQLASSAPRTEMVPGGTTRKSHAAADTRSEVQAALSTLVSGQQQQPPELMVARIGLQVAQALEHAHSRGILHRDIKPANILINPQGDAMVTDFGLARLEDGAELTLTGDIIGTLRYASPEQVLGQHQLVDQRADVYSLGATLFEALSLRPVFEGTNREELLQQITFGQPPRLRQLDRTISQDLETIVQKALEHDPQDRYASAQEMADDLQRFLDHRPLLSRRPNLSQRMAKAARCHPAHVNRHDGYHIVRVDRRRRSSAPFEPRTFTGSVRTRRSVQESGNRSGGGRRDVRQLLGIVDYERPGAQRYADAFSDSIGRYLSVDRPTRRRATRVPIDRCPNSTAIRRCSCAVGESP